MRYCECGRRIYLKPDSYYEDRHLCQRCGDRFTQSLIAARKLPKPRWVAEVHLHTLLKYAPS